MEAPSPFASVEAEARALLQKYEYKPKEIVRTDRESILFVSEDDRAMTAWILRSADGAVTGIHVEGGFEAVRPDPVEEQVEED